MNEKVKKALELLNQNKEMQKEIKQNPPKSKEELIALAKRLGVVLTEADLTAKKDLTDTELENVAGGCDFLDTDSVLNRLVTNISEL